MNDEVHQSERLIWDGLVRWIIRN